MSKTFLITGAGRGIGRGLSRLLLSKGHRVLLTDNNVDELVHLSSQLPKLCPGIDSRNWEIVRGDLTKPTDIKRVVEKASEFFGTGLNCLINNAMYGPVGKTKLENLELDEWERILATNLTGTMLMVKGCLPLLRRVQDARSDNGGSEHRASEARSSSIINISSTRAHQSEPDSEGYATTKAGLLGLTHSLACSLAANETFLPVSVNAILPGWIHVEDECMEADLKGQTWGEGLSVEDQRWHWTGRVGKVEDICRAVEYLVDSSGFVTGQEIVVDGGVSKRMVYPE